MSDQVSLSMRDLMRGKDGGGRHLHLQWVSVGGKGTLLHRYRPDSLDEGFENPGHLSDDGAVVDTGSRVHYSDPSRSHAAVLMLLCMHVGAL